MSNGEHKVAANIGVDNMILLVVDTQKGCFNENLYLFETIKKNIKQLTFGFIRLRG